MIVVAQDINFHSVSARIKKIESLLEIRQPYTITEFFLTGLFEIVPDIDLQVGTVYRNRHTHVRSLDDRIHAMLECILDQRQQYQRNNDLVTDLTPDFE